MDGNEDKILRIAAECINTRAMSDAASPVSADRGHQRVPAGALTTVDRANTGLTKEYKRRLRCREKPFMPVRLRGLRLVGILVAGLMTVLVNSVLRFYTRPAWRPEFDRVRFTVRKGIVQVIIEETEEETDEDEHAPRIGNLHRPSQGNHLSFLRRGLSWLEGIATDVGKDFEGLQMVFARRAAARQCEDPSRVSREFTAWEPLSWESPRCGKVRLANALSAGRRLGRYLHVLVVTDASSAACFGRAPNGLRLLVQILSNDQVFHKYVQMGDFTRQALNVGDCDWKIA